MRRKTFWSIFLPAICTLVISVLITTGIIYKDSHADIISAIRYQAEYLSHAVNEINSYEKNPVAFLQKDMGISKGHRITLVKEDGTVIYDSHVSANGLGNHLDRPEISEASKNGVGEDTRASDTIGSETYYYAIRLENNSILRIAASVSSGVGVFANALLAGLPISLILALLAFIIAVVLSRSISRPLAKINLDNPLSGNTYKELSPVLHGIERKNSEFADKLEALTRQRSEFETVTANMSEGIVLFSSEGRVMSVNKSAKNVISLERGDIYTSLKEDNDVKSILKSALEGRRTVENICRNGKVYRLTASPVTNPYGEYSVVLFILDVTSSEQAESLRREFSANVSHELKTPLTTILGYAEIISNGIARNEDVPTFAENIHAEASRLLTLIEDIIKLSRLDEKNLRAQFEECDLLECAGAVVQRLSEKAQKLSVELTLEGNPIKISGVKPVIYEIIFNLTDNALTYNKVGGRVDVKITGDISHPILKVSDTGIGIAKDEQERIFERFYRVDKSHSRETGGTGLGLSIVKHGVMLHGAEISFESEINVGTTVTVKF